MSETSSPFVLGFAGYSGSGKTTLLTRLIARLQARGLRVGVIKHTHHEFDIDHPGKDSYELRHAGATRIAIGSSRRWAVVAERPAPAEPTIAEMLQILGGEGLDIILVEGFRHERFRKVEVHRTALGRALLAPHDDSIIAIVTDQPERVESSRPRLDIDDIDALEQWVVDLMHNDATR